MRFLFVDSKIPDAFNAAKSITHPIALVAYLAATIMTYFIFRDINRRKAIASAKEEDRANIIIKTAEKIHLDITTIPKSERANLIRQTLRNRIRSQIVVAIVIVIIGLMIALVVVYQISTGSNAEQIKKKSQNIEEMRKLQNAFSIRGITLEGEAVNLLVDSERLTKDWIKWFGGSPIVLTSVSSTFDTLKKFAQLFSYERVGGKWGDADDNNLTVSQNHRLKKLELPTDYFAKGILGTDPNGSPEYAFTTIESHAKHVFGFTKDCLNSPYHDPNDIEDISEEELEETYSGEDVCTKYLNKTTLKWVIENYQYKNMGNSDYGSEMPLDIVSNSSLRSLKFYRYLTGSNPPKDFIMLRVMANEGCFDGSGFDDSTIKLSFSTPKLTVEALLIKNSSDITFTLDNLKFLFSDAPTLRLDSNDKKLAKNYIVYDRKIKLLKGEQLLIPVKIALNTMDNAKEIDETIDPESIGHIYYYGKSFYLDSIGINGYEFPIKQAIHKEVVKAYYNGKNYTAEGSCPYIYCYEPTKGRYSLESHFLYKKNSKSKEGFDTLKLKHPSARMVIAEIDNETSFVDQVFLMCKSPAGTKIYKCQNASLSIIDTKYLVMKKGDKFLIDFGKISIDPSCSYYLVSHGYYKPYGKSYMPPKYFTMN